MKKPAVDYRAFRFSRINEPRFSHIWLLASWLVYFAFYFLTENLIPPEKCHVIHGPLDDLIPFNEGFAIFYCFWYLFLVGTLCYFFFYDVESFKKLQLYIIITQVVAMLAYIFYPSIQLLRPAVMPRDNFLCRVMAFIYAFDTPTGVCPSLHAAYSFGIGSAWLKYKGASRLWKALAVFFVVMICLATVFVKQHSTMDVLMAIPVGVLAEILVYRLPARRTRNEKRA